MAVSSPGAVRAPDDLELARRCAEGDRVAQKQLFDDHRRLVHGVLFRILGTNREIEDLVQDAYLEVFRSLRNFRGDAQLKTWIARITTRVAFAHISKRRPAPLELDAVAAPSDDPSADRVVMAREATRRLYQALTCLDAKYQIAFALHVIDGRSLREVATLMDSTVVAAKTRVWRARREINRRARKDQLLAEYLQEQEVSQ
jgi:RNA polymerase sigma-70 factor (ECF subfamily)